MDAESRDSRDRAPSPWPRACGALLAGALPALAFPAPAWWWFAYVALVPWLLLLRSAPTPRRAALEGWLGGIGFMAAQHHWLAPSLHVFLVVIAALLGALWAPWGWLVHRLRDRAPGYALVLVPAGWTVVELVRSWESLGGPWGLLGASQWQVPAQLRVASLGGVWLVGQLVVAANTALALLVSAPRARTAAVVALVAGSAFVTACSLWLPRPEVTGALRIAVVQPGVIHGYEARFDRAEELTRQLPTGSLDLVVWGESSVGADLAGRPDFVRRLAALSRRTGAELLVNVDARRSDKPGIYKSSILIGPDGRIRGRYDKMRLVPFGEYVPFRGVLGWATSVGRAAGEDRRRGTRPVVLTLADGVRAGPLVCFESAFPDMSRHLVREGADVLVVQSSTSTFQHSWAPGQHASLAALRAAETGRPVVHATLTGVSAVFGPGGKPAGPRLGTDDAAATVYDVPLAEGTTAYVRLGDWALFAAPALLALHAAGEVLRRTARGRAGRPPRTGRASAARPGR
ncbi:apolipoprotein N-acyltransferase [Streptomyces smaragdinus]|uniref:apolipoprotein N-acyltransferase n=1 Tax=Streptomyces smaragdinus TaxID=2585196 RepID=UPI001886A030|nr:apolipoprotein N-acyltransferase [Streptomyces smaragdinus]